GHIDAGGAQAGRVQGRQDEVAGAVLQGGLGQVDLLRVRLFHVADGTGQVPHEARDAFIAPGPEARRPWQGAAPASPLRPLVGDGAQVVAEGVGRSAGVRPAGDGDGQVRQVQLTVVLLNAGIVPVGDFAEEDVSEDVGSQLQARLGNAGDVVHDGDGADDGGDVDDGPLCLGQLLIGHRSVRGAEVHGAGQHLPYAAAAADGLVVDLNARLLVVFVEPPGVNRIREGGARSSQ